MVHFFSSSLPASSVLSLAIPVSLLWLLVATSDMSHRLKKHEKLMRLPGTSGGVVSPLFSELSLGLTSLITWISVFLEPILG
jgi:hypothetical protein